MAYGAVIALPTPVLSSIGLESDASAGITGSVAFVLPIPVLLATGAQGNTGVVEWALPAPQFAAELLVASAARVGIQFPELQLSARGFTGSVGSVAMAMPAFQLRAAQGSYVHLVPPAPALAVSGLTGIVGTVKFTLPVPQMAAVGELPFLGRTSIVLPALRLAAAGLTGNVGSVALTLRQLALATQGYSGVVGSVDLVLPVFSLATEGYGPLVGMVAITMPMLQLVATGSTSTETVAQPNGSEIPAIVMNTETGALSHYVNFPFNSFAAFNGAYLASGPGGLFVLGGDTDNGALINAAARLGITDFSTSFQKRVDRAYVGYRADGDMILRVRTGSANIRDYQLTASGNAGVHGNHLRIGRGLAARYWQFEILNQNGADFQLNMLEVKPTHLRRRIGGGDA